jgi:positive regulator of sigma E activity
VGGIRETGVVVEVTGDRVSIRIRPESPDACASCGGCGCVAADGSRRLEIHGRRDLVLGDRVVVQTSPVSHLAASLLLLLVPMLGLLLGAITGHLLGPRLGLESETGAILGGLGLLTLGFLAVVALDRSIRRRTGDAGPHVVEVLERRIPSAP